MGIGLQAMQLSPCHAGLAEQQFQRLLSVLGFVGRLLFPRPFEFRLAADPRMSSESFPSAMGMLHELLRRTGRWRASGSMPLLGTSAATPPHMWKEQGQRRALCAILPWTPWVVVTVPALVPCARLLGWSRE